MIAAVWSRIPYFGGTTEEKPVIIPPSNIPMQALTKKTDAVGLEQLQQSTPLEATQPWEREVIHLDPLDILKQLIEQIKSKPGLADSIVAGLDEEGKCPETLKAMLCGQSVQIFEHYDKQQQAEKDRGLLEMTVDKPAVEENSWPIYVRVPVMVVSGVATVAAGAGKVLYYTYIEASRVAALVTAVGVSAVVLQSPWLPILKMVLFKVIK